MCRMTDASGTGGFRPCIAVESVCKEQSTATCCRRYEELDPVRWTGFDFIKDEGGVPDISLFVPDSDYDFL